MAVLRSSEPTHKVDKVVVGQTAQLPNPEIRRCEDSPRATARSSQHVPLHQVVAHIARRGNHTRPSNGLGPQWRYGLGPQWLSKRIRPKHISNNDNNNSNTNTNTNNNDNDNDNDNNKRGQRHVGNFSSSLSLSLSLSLSVPEIDFGTSQQLLD